MAPMICEGWVAEAEGADRRSRTARVTKKGERLLARANERWAAVQEAVIGCFGRKAYRALLAELDRLGDCATAADAES